MKNQLNHTDEQLIQQFIQGDTMAMELLVKRHKDRIYTSILLLVKDSYLAEDILQDLFIKIIETLKSGRYKEENRFVQWALRIAHNMCVDYFRKIKNKPVIKTSDGTDLFESLDFSEPGAEYNLIQEQTNEQLMRLVNELPQEQREIIFLRHYANLKFREISKLLGCSVNTVLGRMRYALLNLRKLIEEKQVAF